MPTSSSSGAPKPDPSKYALPEFLECVWLGDTHKVHAVLNDPYTRKTSLNQLDPTTGMNALHIAVGRNLLEITKLLIEAGIEIIPDNEGRMPSLIAAIFHVNDELADYIYEAESRVLKDDEPENV